MSREAWQIEVQRDGLAAAAEQVRMFRPWQPQFDRQGARHPQHCGPHVGQQHGDHRRRAEAGEFDDSRSAQWSLADPALSDSAGSAAERRGRAGDFVANHATTAQFPVRWMAEQVEQLEPPRLRILQSGI